jgi:hypothetical protein
MTRYLSRVVFAAVLFGASLPSQANVGHGVYGRPATGIRLWIAAQTQTALRDIREELKRNLGEALRAPLP